MQLSSRGGGRCLDGSRRAGATHRPPAHEQEAAHADRGRSLAPAHRSGHSALRRLEKSAVSATQCWPRARRASSCGRGGASSPAACAQRRARSRRRGLGQSPNLRERRGAMLAKDGRRLVRFPTSSIRLLERRAGAPQAASHARVVCARSVSGRRSHRPARPRGATMRSALRASASAATSSGSRRYLFRRPFLRDRA